MLTIHKILWITYFSQEENNSKLELNKSKNIKKPIEKIMKKQFLLENKNMKTLNFKLQN